MAAVENITTVTLYKGVPLDVSDMNQVTFDTPAEQQAFFATRAFKTYSNLSYQRKERLYRCEIDADEAMDCNYLTFVNPQYNHPRLFYAFVVGTEYIGNGITHIHFQIDNWQTYMFDAIIKECFVEREHVNSDRIGEHLEDEGLALGDYTTSSYVTEIFEEFYLVIGATIGLTFDPQFPDVGGGMYDNIYSGVTYFVAPISTYEDQVIINELIKDVAEAGKADGIVSMYMVPADMFITPIDHLIILPDIGNLRYPVRVPDNRTFAGYTPKNNKLLTYPYRALMTTNNDGNHTILRYELFNGAPTMEYGGSVQMLGRLILYPNNYKGLPQNYDEGLALGNFPQCTWIKEVYSNWLASQSVRWGYSEDRRMFNNEVNRYRGWGNGGLSALESLAGGSYGGIVNWGQQALNFEIDVALENYNVQSAMSEEKEVFDIKPNSVGGTTGNANTNISIGIYGFYLQERTIQRQRAVAIDEYLSAKGYKVNRVKRPNITGRSSWNYVKTVGAVVLGNIPQEACLAIRRMLDSGVTFWHGDFVGDYSRYNGIGPTPPTPSQYNLNVINGTGGGAYDVGTNVTVTADDSSTPFLAWESTAGYFLDRFVNPGTFVMPAQNCSVTPVYEASTTQTIADLMTADNGALEWDYKVGLIQNWYYGSYVKAAWCTTAMSYYANQLNKLSVFPKHENVDRSWEACYALNPLLCWYTANYGGENIMPKRGDAIYFSSQYITADLTHVGVVTGVSGTTISYCSGNTSNPVKGNPDGIFTKSIDITSKYVVCFYAIPY